MKALVLGGTGATGQLLVQQLLSQGQQVVLLVRQASGVTPQEG